MRARVPTPRPRMRGPAQHREAWLEAERQLVAVAARVMVRPLYRPRLVLAVAAGVTALLLLLRLVQAPSYRATILFRVEEGDIAATAEAPQAPRDIGEHITNVALSRLQLEEIMRKHRWNLAWLELDREAAVADFRSDIGIEVTRDYFIYQRRPGDPPRSAHVAITLEGVDPEETRTILRDIGDAILKAQAQERSGDLSGRAELMRSQLAGARAHAQSLRETIGKLALEVAHAERGRAVALRSQLVALQVAQDGADGNVATLERRVAAVDFGSAVEGKQLGLSFAPFDERLTIRNRHLTPFGLARRAVITLAIVLVLTGVVVGAFDDRIYGPEDLAVRGLPVLGALPRYDGDDAASHRPRAHIAVS